MPGVVWKCDVIIIVSKKRMRRRFGRAGPLPALRRESAMIGVADEIRHGTAKVVTARRMPYDAA
jgi:hypothetical protein